MPLKYDDRDGSWGHLSEGWPSTPYTEGKWLLCTQANVIPYGSYVAVGAKQVPFGYQWDYSEAVIRCENQALVDTLEKAYDGLFIKCAHILAKDPAIKALMAGVTSGAIRV